MTLIQFLELHCIWSNFTNSKEFSHANSTIPLEAALDEGHCLLRHYLWNLWEPDITCGNLTMMWWGMFITL